MSDTNLTQPNPEDVILLSARRALRWLTPWSLLGVACIGWMLCCWDHHPVWLDRAFMAGWALVPPVLALLAARTFRRRRRLVLGQNSVRVLEGTNRLLVDIPYDNLACLFPEEGDFLVILWFELNDPSGCRHFESSWPYNPPWQGWLNRPPAGMVRVAGPYAGSAEEIAARIAARVGVYQGVEWNRAAAEAGPGPERPPRRLLVGGIVGAAIGFMVGALVAPLKAGFVVILTVSGPIIACGWVLGRRLAGWTLKDNDR